MAFRLAQELLTLDEPIPDFSTRFPGAVESCLEVPFQKFYGHQAYPSLVAKAAILFYLMIKNHPFLNGNKRIAVMTLLIFLLMYGKWVAADQQEFLDFTRWVAGTAANESKFAVLAIEAFLRRHIRAATS